MAGTGGAARPPFEVIGVAADAKYRSLIAEAPLLMYVPALADYDGRTHIVVRTSVNPAGLLAQIEQAARSIDRDVPIYHPETMAAHAAESLWQQRMAAEWIGAFSLLALILAGVGLYAVIAQSVAQRTREFGIRMALGAPSGAVLRKVILDGMTLTLVGAAAGIPAAFAASRILRRLLACGTPADVPTLIASGVVLAVVMLAACWIPARRAARVDPLIALRYE